MPSEMLAKRLRGIKRSASDERIKSQTTKNGHFFALLDNFSCENTSHFKYIIITYLKNKFFVTFTLSCIPTNCCLDQWFPQSYRTENFMRNKTLTLWKLLKTCKTNCLKIDSLSILIISNCLKFWNIFHEIFIALEWIEFFR